jgi:hypothetical protein
MTAAGGDMAPRRQLELAPSYGRRANFRSECHRPRHIPTIRVTLAPCRQLNVYTMALNWVMLESDGRPVPLPGEAFINVFMNTAVSVVVGAGAPLRAASGVIYASQQRVCLSLLVKIFLNLSHYMGNAYLACLC